MGDSGLTNGKRVGERPRPSAGLRRKNFAGLLQVSPHWGFDMVHAFRKSADLSHIVELREKVDCSRRYPSNARRRNNLGDGKRKFSAIAKIDARRAGINAVISAVWP